MRDINHRLSDIKEKNLSREIKYLTKPQDKTTVINGKNVLLMSSNNYLGLANNEEVKKAAIQAINNYGLGSGGSRLTTGSYDLHRKLEEKIAEFKGSEDCLIFNNGYMANIGVISAICDENYTIFSDELNHASIIDGARLAKAKIVVYKHNDIKDLENKIKQKNSKYGVIVTDSVFSMDGDIALIDKIIILAKRYKLLTIVDDAHATGVVGNLGRGSGEYFNTKDIDITIGTLSKAIGSEGGFVCANKEIIEFLKNRARSFIFSTALSPAVIGASLKSIEIIENNPQLVKKLNNNVVYFCERLKKIGFDVKTPTPIVPILIGNEELAVKISDSLLELGIFIPAIRYPTVKKGKAILRATLMATHNYNDIDFVIDKIKQVKINF
ncbi:MAG: 8-amino-7-oxononanoate synthase [Paraclostridium sp.]|uniref:8-amino-7-oxononanoate synthase n=1 Tax=Paraclostridium sp. TaxID=2023273 RepID=UPI003F2D5D90